MAILNHTTKQLVNGKFTAKTDEDVVLIFNHLADLGVLWTTGHSPADCTENMFNAKHLYVRKGVLSWSGYRNTHNRLHDFLQDEFDKDPLPLIQLIKD